MPTPVEPYRLLLVEDDESIRAMLAEYLVTRGFSVTLAADGAEALSELARSRFDVLLSDVRMPRVDGVQLVESIAARGGWPPVVLMTGYSADESLEQALAWGARECIAKPFRLEEVEQALRRAVQEAPPRT